MKAQAIVTVIRDVLCLAVGVFGILHQEITGSVQGELLLVYTALLGIPGAIGLLQLSRGRQETEDTHEQSYTSRSYSSGRHSSSA